MPSACRGVQRSSGVHSDPQPAQANSRTSTEALPSAEAAGAAVRAGDPDTADQEQRVRHGCTARDTRSVSPARCPAAGSGRRRGPTAQGADVAYCGGSGAVSLPPPAPERPSGASRPHGAPPSAARQLPGAPPPSWPSPGLAGSAVVGTLDRARRRWARAAARAGAGRCTGRSVPSGLGVRTTSATAADGSGRLPLKSDRPMLQPLASRAVRPAQHEDAGGGRGEDGGAHAAGLPSCAVTTPRGTRGTAGASHRAGQRRACRASASAGGRGRAPSSSA